MIEGVLKFHEKFGLPTGDTDQLMGNLAVQEYRVKFLQEELDELKEALASDDKVKVFDALLDLVYVAQGTALFAGIDVQQWNCGMDAVQRCNMSKVRASSAEDSKRGSAFDVKKPDDFVGPEETLESILGLID